MASRAGFVHLRVHSTYSLLEGAVKPKAMAALSREQGMPAVAITDTDNLFGSLEFSSACVEAGVQPIIGCLVSVFGERLKQARTPTQAKPDRLVLLAKNETGYGNLLKLMSRAYLTPAGGQMPQLSPQHIQEYNAGLIALTAGVEGAVGRELLAGNAAQAEAELLWLKEVFGDRLYMELQRHGLEEEDRIEERMLDLAYAHGIPLVATNDVYFPARSLYEAHDALLCIAEGRYVAEEDRRRLTPEHYFKSPQEMTELFSDIPEAIANTLVIARRCAVLAPKRKPILPSFPTEEGRDEEQEFRHMAREGLAKRMEAMFAGLDSAERQAKEGRYHERLAYELDIIAQMKFPGYFLIVSDFIRWSKRHNIPVGPGRGSGAGSVVAWALEITDLDPLRFGLLFERFLNPERVSMPDFDVDFCQDRRDEVIRYVQQKYGQSRVAQIITFGKLQARAVLRDVGRVLQMPYGQVDKICKLVPNNPANPVTLEQAIEMEPLLQEAIRSEQQVAQLVDIAKQLEGLNRHASTHAAGVVIADRELDELVPLYRDPRSDMLVVQYSMKYAEEAGLVKFDFLGLKTLTVMAKACELIRDRGVEVDLARIPLDDPGTYALLSSGEGTGIFQLESSGMRDVLRKLKPDRFEDIIALVALYRPGPMDNIPTYIARKHGLETVEYPHPWLEPILKETFGVIIYQEQVMEIAKVLAGYSLGGADLLRRAMGKKIKAEMDAQMDIFVKGAVEKGVDKDLAAYIFELVAKFAGYGFNKSHAAAYALIAYQTAWLKANHPVEFLAASMTYEMHNTDKLGVFIQEAERMKIPVLPPDVNASGALFTVEEGKIRYALGALKNVGAGAMASLEEERAKNGKFKDIHDFVERGDSKVLNKRQLENLVKAGALDSLAPNRRRLFEGLELLTRYASAMQEEKSSAQVSLFGGSGAVQIPKPAIADVPDWPYAERLQNEFDAVGFYLSAHPLDAYKDALAKLGCCRSSGLEARLGEAFSAVKVAGIVVGRKIKVGNRGRFAFVQLSDPAGIFEVSVFDETLLDISRELLENGRMLLVTADGKREGEGPPRLIATKIQPLEEIAREQESEVTIPITAEAQLLRLKERLAAAGPGKCRIRLDVQAGDAKVLIKLKERYAVTPIIAEEVG